MKLFSRSVIIASMFFLSLCILPQVARAQVGSPTDIDDPGPDPDTPIDGGVGLLIAAGVVYGIKKIRDQKQNRLKKLP